MAAMNNYTESKANALRRQQDMPTSENLLAYVKTLMRDEILASADAQVERCIKELKKKGLSIKDIALAFDWHDAPYYGKAGCLGCWNPAKEWHMLRLLLPNGKHPNPKEEVNALPLESRERIQELALELMGRIQSYVRSIAYVAFDNSFEERELIKQLLECKPIHPSPARYCKA